MLKKSTENTKRRWKDPEAWKCLDDEQREIIDKWYRDIRKEYDEERKKQKILNSSASMFALTPFVFAYALRYTSSLVVFLMSVISAFLVYSLIFYIFSEAYINLVGIEDNKVEKIIKGIVAVVVSFLLTNLVLHKCGII